MYRSVTMALLLLVGGCTGVAGVPAPQAAKLVGEAKTVGVISAVGSKFALQKVGITVFGNELKEIPATSWGLDDAVASKVRAVLGQRFTVKQISVPQDAFAAYESPGGVIGDSDATLQAIVRKAAGPANCDLYIVVTRSSTSFSTTNQVVTGVGMVESGGAINPDNVILYAVTVVSLYHGRTFERLIWERPGFSIGSPLSIGGVMGNFVSGPHRQLDRTWWPATPQGADNDKLKSAARTLLADSVAQTVPEMLGLKGGVSSKKKSGT
jgi:hypothetical protein